MKTKEQVGGPFQPSRHACLDWEDWVWGSVCGGRAEDQTPRPALPQLLLVPMWGRQPKLLPAHPEAGLGAWFPKPVTPLPLAPKVPGHSRRHSLAASAVPRAHGRSWKKGRQRSQSVPVVLCWHRQASRPSSSGPHSLACPLHLHLGEEHGGRVSANWGKRQQRKG